MNVVLYTTGCPKCSVLEDKLIKKGITYETFDNVDKMIQMGFTEVPILKVDDKIMSYSDAIKWINGRSK